MDGLFACPECGSEVAIGGLAPGRQVRCEFCHRLVEVPYLPRVPTVGWKRQRFGGWDRVKWAWRAVAVVVVVAISLTGFRMARQQYRSAKQTAISEMLASSRANEAQGRLDQALVELDAALDLIRRAEDPAGLSLEEQRGHRADLARREAGSILERLSAGGRDPYPLGDWLNLVARTEKDEDLATIRPKVAEAFHRSARERARLELDETRRAFESGRIRPSMDACDRVAALLPHLSDDSRASVRTEAAERVDLLVRARGVRLETPRGDFVLGSDSSYRARLLPILERTLEDQGYLPERISSYWKDAWKASHYRIRLTVNERLMGKYLASQNRIARIEARLSLLAGDRLVWETTPSARTTVPMAGLPAYLSTRIAVNPERSNDFERLLYEDARSQIEGKFAQALRNMPVCCP